MDNYQLKILSFNVWDLPLSFRQSRKKRMKKIAEYLKTVSADIIFLQEVWFNDTRRLFRTYLADKFYAPTLPADRKNGFSNTYGGLMIFSHQPLLEIKFSCFQPVYWPLSERIGNKGWLATYIQLPLVKLRLINTHLYQPSASNRWQQFQSLISYIQKDQVAPTILAGDFNQPDFNHHSNYITALTEVGLYNSSNSAQTSVYTHRLENIYARSWVNRIKKSEQLDYIFTKNLEYSNLKIVSYEIIQLDPPLSDHDPVVLTLTSI